MRRDGFTLLEVIVAVLLLGMTFAAVFQVISLTLRTLENRDLAHEAMQRAQNKMNEILSSEKFWLPDSVSGDWDDGMRWQADMVAREVDDLKVDRTKLTTRLLDIRLTVFYKVRGSAKEVHLFSSKVVSKPKIGEAGHLGD